MKSKEEILTLIAKRIIQCQKGCFVNAEHKIFPDETQWNDLEDEWYDFIEGEFDEYASEVSRDELIKFASRCYDRGLYIDTEDVDEYLKTK